MVAKAKKATGAKGKRAALGLIEIVVLLDRSGSMASMRDDMVKGFDGFIADQRKLPGRCVVTLAQFDTGGTDVVYEAKPVADVPGLVLVPRGGTPLLDAMGDTITRVSDRISKSQGNARPDRVLFLSITDGEENSSHRFKKEQIQALVKEHTADGWEFSFLGANVDAFAESGKMGVPASGTMNYVPDSVGVRHAFAAVSCSTETLRGGGSYAVRNLDSRVSQHQEPAAVTMGKLGGKTGGLSRARNLTPEQRTAIAKQGAAARWKRGDKA